MAHNNGMVPKPPRKARSAKGVSDNAAKFQAAVQAAAPIAADPAIDPAYLTVPISDLASSLAPPPGAAGEIRRRQEVQAGVSDYQPGRRPAHRHPGTGGGRQRRTSATRCCWASPARARPSPWPRSSRRTQRPALILAPNKTLAAQLYSEFKPFFPENAVEYFVSYYDYYQPEAYIPRTDTYIEKDSSINEEIDRMRHSATRAILERDDVIIVAIGVVHLRHRLGRDLFRHRRGHRAAATRSTARPPSATWWRCNTGAMTTISPAALSGCAATSIDIFPAHYEDRAWRVELFGDMVDTITEFDPLTGAQGGRAGRDQGLCQFALCDAAPDAAAGDEGHQGRADHTRWPTSAPTANCWKPSGWNSAPPSTWR